LSSSEEANLRLLVIVLLLELDAVSSGVLAKTRMSTYDDDADAAVDACRDS
jgi:hypothetical protein